MRVLQSSISIFKIQIASSIQYRIAALANSTTGIFWAIIEVIVMSVFYLYAKNYTAELSLPQAITYIWLAQTILTLQINPVGSEIMSKIKSGDIGVELCRPLDLHTHWFCKIASSKIVPLFLRGIPVLTVGILMPAPYKMGMPSSVWGFIAMFPALIGALFLASAVSTFSVGLLLNIKWGEGPVNMFSILTGVLSGSYLPLQLFPDFMQTFLLYQPFAGFLDIPIRLYIGTLPPTYVFKAISLQLFWTLFFIVTGKLLFRSNMKRLVVQGG